MSDFRKTRVRILEVAQPTGFPKLPATVYLYVFEGQVRLH